MFRNRGGSVRTIHLNYSDGSLETICQQGLNTTAHNAVLKALELKAARYRVRGRGRLADASAGTHNWGQDETGTIDTSVLSRSREEIQQQEEIDIRGVTEEVLQVHGVLPGRKEEGITRLLYENANGIQNKLAGNDKLEKAKDLINELGADVVAYNEHRQNLRHRDNRSGWNQLFKGGEADVRSVVAHNVHESHRIGRTQEGGTGLLMFGPLTEYLDMPASEKDASGLGRWTTMLLKGGTGVQTRIICGYNPCRNSNVDNSTSYSQQRRYMIWHQQDHTTCPRVKFREDLGKLLKEWRAAGDRLIVCLDANENIYTQALGKLLTDPEGLGMVETVGRYTGRRIGPTFFRGQLPIDGIWTTPDVTISNACIMPAGYGIGDHRLFVIDLHTESLVGPGPPRERRAASRRLNTRLPHVVKKYIENLEKNLHRHRLIEKLGEAHSGSTDREGIQARIGKVDECSMQFMKHAAKKCRKIKSGRISFSPESVIWIKREQIYTSLLEYQQGRNKNRGNLKRAARRQGIQEPFRITVAELKTRLTICEEKNNYFREHGHRYRKKHLLRRAEIAQEEGRDEAAKKILAIIKREQDRAFWRKINYTCGKVKGGSPTSVQVPRNGCEDHVDEFTNQNTVHNAIWANIHYKRLYLAEEAPICQGQLRTDFGYNAATRVAAEILEGRYVYPDNFDQATREICEECALIRKIIPKDSGKIKMTKEDYVAHWKRAKEETSSSKSGLHFGHYIAGTESEHISHFHALKATLIFHHGLVLERWAQGLSVMLQKLFGCSLITKLRAILLMEADLNCATKTVYGVRMLQKAREKDLMPEEVFSERNKMADDGTLTKVLTYDVIRQTRRSAGLASVDADNCYDRIAHAIASLVFQAFGVPLSASEAMLTTIQEMKFFLRTGFGDSTDFASSKLSIKTQGLCQGNGASPAGWAVVSICIISAHKKKGHGAHFTCPITKLKSHIAGIIYVDDTDLIHFRMEEDEGKDEAFFNLQEAITNWGKLLLATGGALKPVKCFFHLISFAWKEDGTWTYENNEDNEEYQAAVPLTDGSFGEIQHLGIHEHIKTLGSMTCPSGSSKGALEYMKTKGIAWKDMIKGGKLSRRNVWFMLDKQFWPRISFGLCAIAATYQELSECLMKIYYEIHPQGGIRRTARRGTRQLAAGFYGVGCPHPAVECLAAQLNKFIMHYGSHSCLGSNMQASTELLIIELGLSLQPFAESYDACQHWVTPSWLKSMWEKADKLGIDIRLARIPLEPPRERDTWIMAEFIRMNYDAKALCQLNRVRLHQQVIFLSDIMDASGRAIDSKYLEERPWNERWSSLTFPKERPSDKDFLLWRAALPQIRALGGRLHIGRLLTQGHKAWPWKYDIESLQLFHIRGSDVDLYEPALGEGARTRANRYECTEEGTRVTPTGGPCTVKEVGEGVVKIISFIEEPPQLEPPSTFKEVLEKWGHTWMWEGLRLSGDRDDDAGTWLKEAIEENTLVAVTDGSYMKELYPDVNSCAFILECNQGRGRMSGAFAEQTMAACSYRGELLGLLAIHLILLSANEIHPNLTGSVKIFSDCLGALDKVKNLPPHRIPSKCRHSDILKTIMIHCSSMTFDRIFSHVSAHQDENDDFNNLSREAQLNCACDFGAKRALHNLNPDDIPRQQQFPLEPVSVWAGREKMTSDTGGSVRFQAHKKLAREEFAAAGILSHTQFSRVDWEIVHCALTAVPRMFQVWACKQVWGIAGTNKEQSRWSDVSPLCPSCRQAPETCSHVLHCPHEGRVEALHTTIALMDKWMKQNNTDPDLRDCIYEYAAGRGGITMEEICLANGYDARYKNMAKSQDSIGWRRFMEGMVCKEIRGIQNEYSSITRLRCNTLKWGRDIVTRLLEVTHGQWLYRNVQVHDRIAGTLATQRKEELQMEIERQQELGTEGLLEEDCYLADCNLGDLEETSGMRETYWLLAIQAAREAGRLEGLRNQAREAERNRT